MICSKRSHHSKQLEWVCLNQSCPHKGLMCPQCLMETFQHHKHDAPDIMGYQMFLDAAEACLNESEDQTNVIPSKSLETVQQIIDEYNSRLAIVRDKVIEIVHHAFRLQAKELQSIEDSLKCKNDSEWGPVTRLKVVVQNLVSSQCDRAQAEDCIAYISNYLIKNQYDNSFKLNTEKIYKSNSRKIGERELKCAKERCDEVRKNLSLIHKWAIKLKKGISQERGAGLDGDLKMAGSPVKQKQMSETNKAIYRAGHIESVLAPLSNYENNIGDIIRKRQQTEPISSVPAPKKVTNLFGDIIDLTGKSFESAKSVRSPTKKENNCIEKVGPFAFITNPSSHRSIIPKKEVLSNKIVPNSNALINRLFQQSLSDTKLMHNGSEYFIAKRFDNEKLSQNIHYLESHAISFAVTKEINLIGFSNFTLSDDHPHEFLGHLEYALIEGDGIDDDEELGSRIIVVRTSDFELRRETKKRTVQLFFEKGVRLLQNKTYTLRITNKSKAKISCWQGMNGKDQCGPFKFKKTRDTQFYRLTTNVKSGQIPELLYSN